MKPSRRTRSFSSQLAAPLARQVVNALRAEGYGFTVSTPNRGLRVSLDAGRDDFIELALNSETDQPHVVGRVRRTRGSRTIDEERPIKPGAGPDEHQRRGGAGVSGACARALAGALRRNFGSWRLGVGSLLRSKQQHRNLHQVTDFAHRRSAQQIVEEAMPVRGHRDEIDVALLGQPDQLVGRIAHREFTLHRQ